MALEGIVHASWQHEPTDGHYGRLIARVLPGVYNKRAGVQGVIYVTVVGNDRVAGNCVSLDPVDSPFFQQGEAALLSLQKKDASAKETGKTP